MRTKLTALALLAALTLNAAGKRELQRQKHEYQP